jgi:hypothetical protein
MRRHPPHHLSPARASYRAGPDPEARLSRPKSPQQRSNQARKPVISEQDSCSLALTSGLSRERYRLAVKRRGRRPATPYKWEIYEDDKLVEQSLEYFASKGKAVESGTKVLLRLRIRKAQELD